MTTTLPETDVEFIEEILAICDANPDLRNPIDPTSKVCLYKKREQDSSAQSAPGCLIATWMDQHDIDYLDYVMEKDQEIGADPLFIHLDLEVESYDLPALADSVQRIADKGVNERGVAQPWKNVASDIRNYFESELAGA